MKECWEGVGEVDYAVRPSVFEYWCYGSQAFTLLQRLEDRGTIFLDDYISEDGSQALEKDILRLQNQKESGKRCASWKDRKKLQLQVF